MAMTSDGGPSYHAQTSVAPRKHLLIDFTPIFAFAENFHPKVFPTSKNEMLQIVWNAFSQSFMPIGAILGG